MTLRQVLPGIAAMLALSACDDDRPRAQGHYENRLRPGRS